MITSTRRRLVRVSMTQDGEDGWECRLHYYDDDTDDRRGGFTCRANAHGWAEARIQRHFGFGVPGRAS